MRAFALKVYISRETILKKQRCRRGQLKPVYTIQPSTTVQDPRHQSHSPDSAGAWACHIHSLDITRNTTSKPAYLLRLSFRANCGVTRENVYYVRLPALPLVFWPFTMIFTQCQCCSQFEAASHSHRFEMLPLDRAHHAISPS
jgi:hypothetical protein